MLKNQVFDFVFSRKDSAFPSHSLLVFDIQGDHVRRSRDRLSRSEGGRNAGRAGGGLHNDRGRARPRHESPDPELARLRFLVLPKTFQQLGYCVLVGNVPTPIM